MVAVDGGVQNLIQGVSQQPRRDRRDGQCTLQENMSSDVVRNLSRRSGTNMLGGLFNSATDHEFEAFDTGAGGLHFLSFANNKVRAFDAVDGTEKTVNNSTDTYISADMVTTVIDGEMWVADVGSTVAMETTTKAIEIRALVQVLGGQYGRVYEIVLGYPPDDAIDVVITYTTPNGGTAADILNIATDYIAEQLETSANGLTNFTDHYTIERKGDVLLIEWKTETTRIEVTANDGEGGDQLIAVGDRTDRIAYLPRYAPEGYVVKVQGIEESTADDVWFKFTQEKSGFGYEGVWEETVATNITFDIDAATMPHKISYDSGADEFTIAEGVWSTRDSGDLDTNPDPSFVGTEIQDMASFQGRMAILTSATIIMSRTNDILDFFRGTATDLLDTDPIDISSTARSANTLKHLVPHNRDLVIFSDKAQFIIFGRTSLTPLNASLVLSTEFQVNLDVAPALSGRNVFFASDYGNFTSLREFFTEGNTDANDSRPITTHVNKYVPSGMTKITSSSNFDAMLTHGATNECYIYQFLWNGQEKLQSSWGTWTLDAPIAYSHFDRSTVYFILKDADDEYILTQFSFENTNDVGVDYEVCLDRKQTATSGTEDFVVTNATSDMVAVQGAGCANPGLAAQVGSINTTTNTITMETTYAGTLIFGVPYTSRYQPTMPMMKDQKDIKIGTGRLVLNRMIASFENSGSFRTIVTSKYADDLTGYMSGRFVGDPDNIVGEQPIIDGSWDIYVGDDADIAELEVWSDAHTPFTLVDLEWTGQWNKTGKRR